MIRTAALEIAAAAALLSAATTAAGPGPPSAHPTDPSLSPMKVHTIDGEPEGGLFVVGRDRPIDARFRADLEEAGVDVVQYLPPWSYLVWSPDGRPRRLKRSEGTSWRLLDHREKTAAGADGQEARVRLLVAAMPTPGDALDAIRRTGAVVERSHPAQPDGRLIEVVARIDTAARASLLQSPRVAWIEPASTPPVLAGEAAVSEVLDHVDAAGVPLQGARGRLADLGVDGAGVTWAVVDSGVDRFHPDLPVAVGIDVPGCETDPPGDDRGPSGHGTLVAGILGGTAATGMSDDDGRLYGLGVAPRTALVAHNGICFASGSDWPPLGGWQAFSRDVVRAGAVGSNNSWSTSDDVGHGYTLDERTHDFMVRDADFDTADVAEPLILVFVAGNLGPDPGSLRTPAEAKNLVVVGATADWSSSRDAESIADFSGRGPTADGRIAPTVVAPGVMVAASLHRDGGYFGLFEIPQTAGLYAWFEGTSAATPVVSGALALWVQQWRHRHGGRDPSPALARAMLVHTADDVGGDPPPPNGDEGWGRLRADRLLRADLPRVEIDQEITLTDTGEEWTSSYRVADRSRPVTVTLAWSDAPAMPGADPALVNDLDLTVTTGGAVLVGNSAAAGGPTPDASPDRRNNVERVVARVPGDSVEIRVSAFHLPGDGVPLNGVPTDQDFALVCDNCRRPPVVPPVQVVPPAPVR